MTLEKIEYFKIEIRKALGLPDASDRSFDNTTHFKVQSEKSKSIGGASKLLIWTDDLEQEIEQQYAVDVAVRAGTVQFLCQRLGRL